MESFQNIEHFVKSLYAAIKKKIPTKVSQLTNDAGYKTTDTNTTYKLSKSGSTVTLTGSDGSTTSVTDSNTTYSSLKNPYSLTIQNNGTTVASYDGSTAKTANFTNATTSANGLMSKSDKAKLDGIDPSAITTNAANIKKNADAISAEVTRAKAAEKANADTISKLNSPENPALLGPEDDLNNVLTGGFYHINNGYNPANMPSGNDNAVLLVMQGRFHADIVQILISGNSNNILYRTGNTLTKFWKDWRKIADNSVATESTDGLMSAADKKAVDREFFRMLPKGGTVIPNGANLNSTAYLKVGNYYQSAIVNTTNMTNIPIKSAFMMYVLSPLSEGYDNESTAQWVYRLRIFVEYTGNNIFIQTVSSGTTAGSFDYGPWVKMTNSNDLGVISNTINTHIANKANPHAVTKAQVGLGNVDNTADSAKSVKYATSAGSVTWNNVSGKPSTYPPSSHTHDDRYEIAYRSNFASHDEYIRLGIATMRQQGDYLFIRVYSGSGYNGQITQDRAFDIHLRTSNGNGSLYAGYVEYHLNGSSNNDVYIVPKSSGTTYDIWIGLTSYSGNGFYIVEESNGAGWSNSQTTSNSIPSGAIKLTQKNIAYTSDIPTSLPANGGNAATVNGHSVNANVPSGAKFTDTTYGAATQSSPGLMSAADKKKLDGVSSGADVSPIKTVKVNGTALTPDSNKAVNVTVPTLANNATTTTSGMALDARMGKTLSDQISSVKTGAIDQIVNLTAAGWTGGAAPYSQTVNVTGMTDELLCELFSACPKSATVAEREAYNEAFALVASGYAETADGSATFLVDEKPTIDIGVRIKSISKANAVSDQTSSDITNAVDAMSNTMWEKIYPVGSIYISANSTSPAELFGGTWEQIKDRFLLAAGDTYAAGSTGGEAEHTLTVDEMPSHHHAINLFASGPSGIGTTLSDAQQGKPLSAICTASYATASDDNYEQHIRYTGGNAPHNNMPPYLAIYMWQRVS